MKDVPPWVDEVFASFNDEPQGKANGQDGNKGGFWQLLHKMAQDGEVTKLSRGKYQHPDRVVPTPAKDDKSVRKGEK